MGRHPQSQPRGAHGLGRRAPRSPEDRAPCRPTSSPPAAPTRVVAAAVTGRACPRGALVVLRAGGAGADTRGWVGQVRAPGSPLHPAERFGGGLRPRPPPAGSPRGAPSPPTAAHGLKAALGHLRGSVGCVQLGLGSGHGLRDVRPGPTEETLPHGPGAASRRERAPAEQLPPAVGLRHRREGAAQAPPAARLQAWKGGASVSASGCRGAGMRGCRVLWRKEELASS